MAEFYHFQGNDFFYQFKEMLLELSSAKMAVPFPGGMSFCPGGDVLRTKDWYQTCIFAAILTTSLLVTSATVCI